MDALKLFSEAQNAKDELFNNDSKASVDGLVTMVGVLWNDAAFKRIHQFQNMDSYDVTSLHRRSQDFQRFNRLHPDISL
jgi:hypothetical protein